jgi:hypothetical protein
MTPSGKPLPLLVEEGIALVGVEGTSPLILEGKVATDGTTGRTPEVELARLTEFGS